MNKEKKPLSKVLGTALTFVVVLFCIWIAYKFPPNLALHLFQGKMGAAELAAEPYNYGQFAGRPAGEGGTELESMEQFRDLTSLDYITFETDSIIPLDLYRLKSGTDKVSTNTRRGYRSNRRQRSTYIQNSILVENVYNRYYMVKLPDGNYVAAYLDDAYYIKYLLGGGKVQLPLGRPEHMTREEAEYLASDIAEHGLDEEMLLVMFAEEDYEEQKLLHTVVPVVVFFVLLGLVIAVDVAVTSVLKKKRGQGV